jgi:hypothetical protein
MSTFAAFGRLDKEIAAADAGSIRRRWEYARRLLCDPAKATPDGRLNHGVIDALILAAAKQGIRISRREIQYRLQAGRTYQSEAEFAQLVAQFETWKEAIQSGFPAIALPLDADLTPYDPRTPEERARDAGITHERLEQEGAGQLPLFDHFPADLFDELSTLGELEKHAGEMAEWTRRRARKDSERAAYLRQLIAAVGGDRSKTWREAQDAMDAAAPAP